MAWLPILRSTTATTANPHAHVLLTPGNPFDGFGLKVRDWNDRELLVAWRESWASHCNQVMKKNGIAQRIDHRTLAAQGIERIATKHEGVRRKKFRRALVKKRGGGMGRKQPVRAPINPSPKPPHRRSHHVLSIVEFR